MNQQQITSMARIMVKARRANEDVGELIAVSLHEAADKLGNVELLVKGRPGSWEADIIRRMAHTGGTAKAEYSDALTPYFLLLPACDGGDTLSQAMSRAVDTLGGLDAFAGTSQWYHDLINIGCQYSQHAFSSASVYRQVEEEK